MEKTSHRARIVSASHFYSPHHAVHGNGPTVMLSTLSMLISVLPTWMKLSENEKLVVFLRDVIKTIIQSLKSQKIVVCQRPPKFFEFTPLPLPTLAGFHKNWWRGRRWFALVQDPSNLGLGTHPLREIVNLRSIASIQSDAPHCHPPMNGRSLHRHFRVAHLSWGHHWEDVWLPRSQFFAYDFKGADILRDGNDFVIYQMAYLPTHIWRRAKRRIRTPMKKSLNFIVSLPTRNKHNLALPPNDSHG